MTPAGPRSVDARKTRKALRKLRKIADAAAAGAEFSAWESEFAAGLGERLGHYGSAFRDSAKGRLDEPLSERQAQKLKELLKKAAAPEPAMDEPPASPADRAREPRRAPQPRSWGRKKRAPKGGRFPPESAEDEAGSE